MKILGAVLCIVGFLGIAYIIEETRIIDSFGDFGGVVFIFIWVLVTMGIGTALMNVGGNNKEE